MKKNQQKSLQAELLRVMRSTTTIPELKDTDLTNVEVLANAIVTKAISTGDAEMCKLIISILGDTWVTTG